MPDNNYNANPETAEEARETNMEIPELDYRPISLDNVSVENLRSILEYVTQQIDSFCELPPETRNRLNPGTLEALERRRQECGNITRDVDVLPSLGTIGNVASGKTSVVEMLHGLIGGPLFLSVGQNATTGNIVEYNIQYEPGDDRTSPSYDDWNVVFLSEDDLNRLTATYRKKIERSLIGVNVVDSLEFENLFDNVDGKAWNVYWHDLREWAIKTYNVLNPNYYGTLRQAIYELFLLAECAYVYRNWIGRTEKISSDQAGALLKLNPNNIPPGQLVAHDNFLESKEVEKISPDEIHNLFFLVKNLRTTVRVSQEAARTFAVPRQNGAYWLRVVDCPGLGSTSSPIRDNALCIEQLKDLDVILMLLDAGSQSNLLAAGNLIDEIDPNGTSGILQRVVVAINKFDSIKMKPEEYGRLEGVGAFTDEQSALNNFGSFQAIYTTARKVLNNTKDADERITFLSPYCFVGGNQKFATRDFIEQTWNGTLAASCSVSYDILRKYIDKFPNGTVKNNLNAFLKDGGATRLRDVYTDMIRNAGRLHQTANQFHNLEELVRKWNALKVQVEREFIATTEVPLNEELTSEQTSNALRQLEGLFDGLTSVSSIWRKLFNYYVNYEKKRERDQVAFKIFLSKFWKSYFRASFRTDNGKISLADKGLLPERTDDAELRNRYFADLHKVVADMNAYVKDVAIPRSFRDYMKRQNVVEQDNYDRDIETIIKSIRKVQELKAQYGAFVDNPQVAAPDPLVSFASCDVLHFDNCLTALFSDVLLQELTNLADNEWDDQRYYPLQMQRVDGSSEQGAYFAWADCKSNNQNVTAVKRQLGSLGVVAIQNAFIFSGIRFIEDFLEESKARVFNKIKSLCDGFRKEIDYYIELADYWHSQKVETVPTPTHNPSQPALEIDFGPSAPTEDDLNDL